MELTQRLIVKRGKRKYRWIWKGEGKVKGKNATPHMDKIFNVGNDHCETVFVFSEKRVSNHE